MRRHIAVLSVAAAIAGAFAASPAHATCMETFNKGGIRQGYCSPPGGPVTSYTCFYDTCIYLAPAPPAVDAHGDSAGPHLYVRERSRPGAVA